MSRTRIWIGIAVIFLAGAATGVLGLGTWIHHKVGEMHARGPAAMHDLLLLVMDHHLQLEDDQRERIEAVLFDVHMDFLDFHNTHSVRIREIVEDGMARLEAELTPAQMPEWRALRDVVEGHLRSADHVARQHHAPDPAGHPER